MKKVFITGAAGFAGRYLTQEMLRAGVTVSGTYCRTPPPSDPTIDAVRWMPCDVTNREAVAGAIEQCQPDTVVHLAAMSVPTVANRDPAAAFDTNVSGTVNVLEGARKIVPKCRVLLISSCHAYGDQPAGRTGLHENLTLTPRDAYGATRAAAETIALAYARQFDMDIVVARPFNHCGPRQEPHYFVSTLVEQVVRCKNDPTHVVRLGNLDVVRDFSDIRDVVAAYIALVEHGESGCAYNVCSGEPIRLQRVVDLLREIVGVDFAVSAESAKVRPGESSVVFGDPARIVAQTGWQRRHELSTTLEDTFKHAVEKATKQSASSAQVSHSVSAMS